MISEILYPFGYLLTKNDFHNEYSWAELKVNYQWTLYYSSENRLSQTSNKHTQIIILGYFFDIRNSQLEDSMVLEKLVSARKKSYEEFLEELSFISGRYLLILSHKGKLNIYNDISALRPVCFHKEEMIIGSHDTLINEVMGNKLKQVFFNPDEISFSNKTRFEYVEKLIPNMSLDINSGELKRYYPLKEFPMRTREEIKSELLLYLRETARWIRKSSFKPLLSLTGGGDSRMSLAVLKPLIHNLETFTYLKDTSKSSDYAKKTFATDEKVVNSLVDNLNLNHRFFIISTDDKVNNEIKNTIKHNVFSNHGLNLANDYYKLYRGNNYLHIRSTALFNIGKYIFPASSINIKEWSIKEISSYVQKWTNIEDEEKNTKYVTDLIKFAQLEDFYNYNPLEMLFLSYRLIQWHSGVVGESDVAFDTMLLLNARKIVDLLLSYPIKDRYENKLFHELIEELWPVLNYWGVNTDQTLKEKYDSLSESVVTLEKVNNVFLLNSIKTKSNQEKQPDCTIFKKGIMIKLGEKNIPENTEYEVEVDLSNYKIEGNLSIGIEFYYKNEKGRDRIFVSSPLFSGTKDILDLYGRHDILLNNLNRKNLKFKIHYSKPCNGDSWVNAGRVWIGDIKLVE